MEKVVKRALDRFTEPKQNEDFTHVIYSKGEHNKKNREISELEANIKKLEREYKIAVDNYKKSADDKIAKIRTQADGRVAEAHAERDKHKERAEDFENANQNLIRVATERANAQRGLTPKKQHIGYVFLNIEQYIYNHECFISGKNKKRTLKLDCFRVRLQSPYQTNFDLQSVVTLTTENFDKKNIYNKLGIEFGFEIDKYDDAEITKLWNTEKDNFIFKVSYKANFQKGFWEVEYLTRYMVNVPSEMIIVR